MLIAIQKFRHFKFFFVPAILMLLLALITKSNIFKQNQNQLSLAITFDFILSIPFIYFLIIRKKNIDKRTVFTVLSIGILLASFVIPKENQTYLSIFKKWFFPILEIGIFSYLIISIKKTIEYYKQQQKISIDFFEALKIATKSIFPTKIAAIISAEIATFYYGFSARKKMHLLDNEYTYHKYSGTITLLYFFICLILIETGILHLLVAKYSTFWAWILTGLSIYAALQFWGFTKAIQKRPIKFEAEFLKLNYGIFCETKIKYENIISIKLIKNFNAQNEIVQLSPLKTFEQPNILIELSEENTIEKLYGGIKKYKSLALYIDDYEQFINKITQLSTKT